MRNQLNTLRLWVGLVLIAAGLVAAIQRTQGQVPEVPAAAAGKPLLPEHKKAALINMPNEINELMKRSMERRVDIARKQGCSLIIFQMDTWGGDLATTLEMTHFIKTLPDPSQGKITTVAWVNNKAISAGAIISAACQQIVIADKSMMGDAAPIQIDEQGRLVPMPVAERAKIVSPILQDLADSAERNNHDLTLLKAMVQPQIEIFEMRSDEGVVRFVDGPGKQKLLDEEVRLPDGGVRRPWKYIKTVDSDGQLLTIGTNEALAMGLAKARIDTEAELRAALNITGDLIVLDFNWLEVTTLWLTQWWVRGFLFMAMLVLAYIEFSHPGISIAGIGALICLILLIGAPYLTGLAQTWQIAIIVLGLCLIISDFFIFGGTGFIAIPGVLLMIVGIIASFVPAEPGGGIIPSSPAAWTALTRGMSVIAGASLLSILIFYFLSRYLYMTPGFRRLQLAPSIGPAEAEETVRDSADRPAMDAVFVGAYGTAATELRPAGKARFGEHLVDVVTNGQFVTRNSEVEVLEIYGNRIVVKPRAPQREAMPGDAAGESP